MAKRPLKLHVRIPEYESPRNSWRRKVHAAATAVRDLREVEYRPDYRLEIDVRLYLDGSALIWNDVDNRLKDVLDALQGRVGGPKAVRSLPALIPNDRQVFRVVVEKCAPPKQSLGCGHVTVRGLRRRRV